jgi:GMP synthase-like glutamine amidotransferase
VRIRYLQHVPYERVGWIEDWAQSRGHEIAGTMTYAEPSGPGALPEPEGFDLLVVMGGPMNVYDYDEYPWLPAEKELIGKAIFGGRMALGICLGAQLIADVLGGEVTKAPFEEIGWHPVKLTEAGRRLEVFAHFPDRFTTLQWHGDTFSIPPGAVHAASSEAVPNQAFALDGGRVIGLQFHLEETRETLSELVGVAGGGLPKSRDPSRGPWVSPRADLLAPGVPFDVCRDLLYGLLDRMAML